MNPKNPDPTPIPPWAKDDPEVRAQLDRLRAALTGREAMLELNPSPGSVAFIDKARAKIEADLKVAIERCRPPEPPPRPELTFERLKELEPLLDEMERRLRERAEQYSRKKWWCANACWFGSGRFRCFDGGESFRQWLPRLVGWFRPKNTNDPNDELLRSSEAYDCAYDALYLPLPGCKDCACM